MSKKTDESKDLTLIIPHPVMRLYLDGDLNGEEVVLLAKLFHLRRTYVQNYAIAKWWNKTFRWVSNTLQKLIEMELIEITMIPCREGRQREIRIGPVLRHFLAGLPTAVDLAENQIQERGKLGQKDPENGGQNAVVVEEIHEGGKNGSKMGVKQGGKMGAISMGSFVTNQHGNFSSEHKNAIPPSCYTTYNSSPPVRDFEKIPCKNRDARKPSHRNQIRHDGKAQISAAQKNGVILAEVDEPTTDVVTQVSPPVIIFAKHSVRRNYHIQSKDPKKQKTKYVRGANEYGWHRRTLQNWECLYHGLLLRSNNDASRIEKVVRWFCHHDGEDLVPTAQTFNTFCLRFAQIEKAMRRSNRELHGEPERESKPGFSVTVRRNH